MADEAVMHMDTMGHMHTDIMDEEDGADGADAVDGAPGVDEAAVRVLVAAEAGAAEEDREALETLAAQAVST